MPHDSRNKNPPTINVISQAVMAIVSVLTAVFIFVWFIMNEASDMKANAQEIERTQQRLSDDFDEFKNNFNQLRADFDSFAKESKVQIEMNTSAIEELSAKVDKVGESNSAILALLNRLCGISTAEDCIVLGNSEQKN